jgi:hypothetical protein
MSLQYKNPLTSSLLDGSQSALRTKTFGTNFSVLQTGGYMEVYTLNDLVFSTNGQTGLIEYSGNTIPIKFNVRTLNFLPDVLTLESDNISTGRQRLGMLVYVKEVNQVYQLHIDNYNTLWDNAVADGDVIQTEYGTSVYSNHAGGRALINAWSASTIEGVGGITRPNAKWRKYYGNDLALTGGSFNSSTGILTMVTITGGTVPITGFGTPSGGTSANITGGTSFAGTGGTRDISLTLINSGQTEGVDISLLEAFSFENDNAVKVTVGGVSAGTAPFSAATSIHEIIQQIFYPRIAPVYSPQRNASLILSPSTTLFEIAYEIPTLLLNSFFTRGTYTGGIYVKNGGLPTSYVYSGPDISPSHTATTTSLNNSYSLSNYVVTIGYNSWNLQVNYSEGDIPVYDTNEPFPVPSFTNSGFTNATDRFEGVYPIFANSTTINTKTRQSLVSMITSDNVEIYFAEGENNNGRQYFEIADDWINSRAIKRVEQFSNITQWTLDPYWTNITSTTNTIQGVSVNYKRYTYAAGIDVGFRLIRLVF